MGTPLNVRQPQPIHFQTDPYMKALLQVKPPSFISLGAQ
jgi:hypothetical protein